MKVSVKDFGVLTMEIKNKGIELDVYDNDNHLGDLVVKKSGLVWCKGRTSPANGAKITWKKFIEHMESL